MEIIETYKRQKYIRIMLSTIGIVFISFSLYFGEIFGVTANTKTYSFLCTLTAAILFSISIYLHRCPKCNKFLSWQWSEKECKNCGEKLYEITT